MNQKIKCQIILALCISIVFIACKGKGKSEEQTQPADTTANVQPAAKEEVPDAVTVTPNLYKVVKDTMGIKVSEVTYKPGDSSAFHSHHDYAIIVTSGGEATFYGKDGSKAVSEMPTGMTLVKAAESHSVKNTGKTTVEVVLVEVNRPATIISQDAATDATKVAPTVYKIKNDTLGIRVLEVNARPGQSIAMHSHPDNVLYVTEGGTGEFTDKNGTKTVAELKKGMMMVGPAESHSVKNTGKTTLKAILVEVNRVMN